MGVKVKDLDSPLKSFLVDGEVRGATDSEIEDAGGWHQGQEASLASGVDATTVQKFFDFVPRRVFLPWLEALTQKSKKDGDVAKGCAIGLDFVPLVFDHLFPENGDDNESSCSAAAITLGQISTALGYSDEDALEKRYFLFDQKTQGLYYYNKRELMEIRVFKYPATPIYSFSSNAYDPESATPMSGIAVAKAIEPVDARVKTLEEETVPALDERMTGAEEDIEAEQERTDFLLGDARDMIISRRVYNEDESVFNNPENDPSAIGLSVLNNLIKRNALRGIAENDADTWYYLLDMETKGIYYLNYQILQEWLTHGNPPEPIISFAALNEYNAESSTAMSGIAVAEALEIAENGMIKHIDAEILPELEKVQEGIKGKVIKSIEVVDSALMVEFTDGTSYKSESLKGEKGDTGVKGDQGEKGDAGYTPVKHVDYFTQTDKEEMVDDVLDVIGDQFFDVRHIENAKSGPIEYSYNFVPGHIYKVTNNLSTYLVVRTKDENGEYVNMINEKGVEEERFTLKENGGTVTFTAGEGAVVLYLYFGAAGNVVLEDLSLRFHEAETSIKAASRKSEITDFAWVLGGITASTGADVEMSNRIRTGFIPVTGYESTVVFDGEGRFIVFEYASNDAHSSLIRRVGSEWVANKYTVVDDACKYIRIVAKKVDGTDFTDETTIEELGSHFKLTQSFFTRRTIGRYVSPEKEAFHYDGELEEWVDVNKLATIYAKWDELQETYPNVVSKTILGTVDGKEIRSYRITPYPMRESWRIARYSCEPLKILYVSCIHGHEGAIAVDDFALFKNLVVNHKPSVLWNNCVFEIIPVANPVGYDTNKRSNGNGVNINRNFPVGWTYSTDEYDASGAEPCSEYETNVLMEFVKSHPDAFLVMNRHGTDSWRGAYIDDEGNLVGARVAGYSASAYQSDIETIIASGVASDTMLRSMPEYSELINVVNPDKCLYSVMHGDVFNGTFDRWYNAIGYHGYLLEYTDRFESGYLEKTDDVSETNNLNGTNGTVRRMNITTIANLLCDSVLNNREIIANNHKLPGEKVIP